MGQLGCAGADANGSALPSLTSTPSARGAWFLWADPEDLPIPPLHGSEAAALLQPKIHDVLDQAVLRMRLHIQDTRRQRQDTGEWMVDRGWLNFLNVAI